MALIAAEEEPAQILPEIDEVVRVAQLREVGMHALERVAEEVLMRHRDDRDGHAREAADLGREHAASVHDELRRDRVALARVLDGESRHATSGALDRHDAVVLPDVDAAGARTSRQREGQARWVEPAVGREPRGAADPLGRHEREPVAGFVRPDELKGQAERARPPGLPAELLHPLVRRGETE